MKSVKRLPIAYFDPDENKPYASSAAIAEATPQELERFSSGRVCGECRHFDHHTGLAQIASTRFVQKLAEQQWNPAHLAGILSREGGLCGASGGTMATSVFTVGCDQWTPRHGRVERRQVAEEELAKMRDDAADAYRRHQERWGRWHRETFADEYEARERARRAHSLKGSSRSLKK